jgi:hypothetical protein
MENTIPQTKNKNVKERYKIRYAFICGKYSPQLGTSKDGPKLVSKLRALNILKHNNLYIARIYSQTVRIKSCHT